MRSFCSSPLTLPPSLSRLYDLSTGSGTQGPRRDQRWLGLGSNVSHLLRLSIRLGLLCPNTAAIFGFGPPVLDYPKSTLHRNFSNVQSTDHIKHILLGRSLVNKMGVIQLAVRDAVADIKGAPQTFSSWDNCMHKAYCKYEAKHRLQGLGN